MNVIWVTTSVPHPQAGGGRAHEFELIRSLARRHDIHVVSCDFGDQTAGAAVEEAGARFTQVRWMYRPYPTSKLGVARGLLRAHPTLAIWLSRDRIGHLAAKVREISAQSRPDVVQVTHGELASILREIEAPTGLLLFDALTRALSTRRAVEPLFRRRLQLRVEHARAKRFEREEYSNATGIASVSSVDAGAIESLVGRPITVLENPIADDFFATPDRPRSRNIVTFVGALAHQPNSDAIDWLVRDIWPLVTRVRPDAELKVVGRADNDPTVPALTARVAAAGGRVEADVPDIRPYYWEAAVVIAPLRHGSGLRNKVIHALACGAPVVASPTALEGIPEEMIVAVRTASGAADTAAAILAVLDDPEAAAHRSRTADSLAPLRTGEIAARHDDWWREIAETRRAARS